MYLVLEFAKNDTLFKFIRSRPITQISLGERVRLFVQVLDAVEYIHSQRIVHRDLKPENILLDENMNVKLSDFGWAVELREGQSRRTFCGTYEYMAPEVFEGEDYGFSVDIWAIGVLLFELLQGRSPFVGKSVFQIFKKIISEPLSFDPDLDPEAEALLRSILVVNPNNRCSITEIRNHNFVVSNLPKTEPKLPQSASIDKRPSNFVLQKSEKSEKIERTPVKDKDLEKEHRDLKNHRDLKDQRGRLHERPQPLFSLTSMAKVPSNGPNFGHQMSRLLSKKLEAKTILRKQKKCDSDSLKRNFMQTFSRIEYKTQEDKSRLRDSSDQTKAKLSSSVSRGIFRPQINSPLKSKREASQDPAVLLQPSMIKPSSNLLRKPVAFTRKSEVVPRLLDITDQSSSFARPRSPSSNAPDHHEAKDQYPTASDEH